VSDAPAQGSPSPRLGAEASIAHRAAMRSFASRLFGYDVFLSFAFGPSPRGTLATPPTSPRLGELDYGVFFREEETPPHRARPSARTGAAPLEGAR